MKFESSERNEAEEVIRQHQNLLPLFWPKPLQQAKVRDKIARFPNNPQHSVKIKYHFQQDKKHQILRNKSNKKCSRKTETCKTLLGAERRLCWWSTFVPPPLQVLPWCPSLEQGAGWKTWASDSSPALEFTLYIQPPRNSLTSLLLNPYSKLFSC